MSIVQPQAPVLTTAELVKLGAVDTEFYARTWFPQTFRHPSPSFAKALWGPLEDPKVRLANMIVFRGGSKTTRLRVFTSKRIAYGISRTILYIGNSESDAARSIQWIRNRVERNRQWASTFGLKPGRKWEETQIEIEHSVLSDPTQTHTIWVQAAGIKGSLRGINFDDYRPDLIVVDDPQDDESAATEAQREKIADLLLGAVKNSLAPSTDEPNAKLVMAITPQHPEDISQRALKDSEWTSQVFPCWTRNTIDFPTDQQESAWPERFPTLELRKQKRFALERNKLSIFTREMECRLISRETSQFRTSWLNIRSEPAPRGLYSVLAIDPVPPPSEAQMARGLQGKDYEAHYVWGRADGDNYHLLDFARSRGHQPTWTVATAFRLARLYRVAHIVIDAVAYQRTLKWILESWMQTHRVFYPIVPVADGMKKFARISNVVGGLAAAGKLWIGPEHTEFASQYEAYGPTYAGFDDDLDASALALQELHKPYLNQLDESGAFRNDDVEALPFREHCP